MDPQQQKDLIRRGYDAISRAYRGDQETPAEQPYHSWLDLLLARLQPGAPVLVQAARARSAR